MLRVCLRSTPKRVRPWGAAAVSAAALSSLLTLSACGSPPASSTPSTADLPARPSPPARARLQQPLTIGPNGAFALTDAAGFTVAALGPHFPGLELIAGTVTVDRRTAPVIQVRSDGLTLYEIFPASDKRRVGEVRTRSPAVAGPLQDVVGATRMRDLPREAVAFCSEEVVAGENRQVCADTPGAAFRRVFRSASDIEPANDAASKLDQSVGSDVLIEMRWRPPAKS